MKHSLTYIAHIRLPTEWAHGIQIMKMCEAFASQGIEVELVVPNRYSAITEDPFSYYAVKKTFTITRLGHLSRPSNKLTYLWSLVSFSMRACAYARKKKFGIIYSRDEVLLFIFTFFFRTLVWEAHGWKKNWRVRRLGKKLRHIIAITEAAKRRFVQSGIDPRTMLVAPDGIDESFFHTETNRVDARRQFGLPLEERIVMYVGLLDAWKGYQTLLEAAPRLKQRGIRVVIVGGAEEHVRALRAEHPDALFLGFTVYRLLPVVQAAADILVVPNSARSLVSAEYTSPLKVFAHMASGRPMVVSDLPSLREVLDEETAYFFEPDNSENLAHIIEYVAAHEQEAAEKARKALIKAKDYTWNTRARTILAFLGSPIA